MKPGEGGVAIRRACPEDVAAIDQVHRNSIRELCSPFYTGEQIDDWLSAVKPKGYIAAMELCDFMVAMDGGIVGLCIFNAAKAEITALYVSPRAAGRGVGRLLLQEAEALAREGRIRGLHLKSTLNAVSFYEHMGFTRIERVVYVLPSGTELPCVLMEKHLPLLRRSH